MNFKITKKSKENNCRARTGIITTQHGKIQTPAFIPVATKAAVKALSADAMKQMQAELLICNTYHLMLKPGEKLVKKMGGLQSFMSWNGPVMTDSGGFQAFSLGAGTELTAKKIAIFPDEESKKRTLKELKNKKTQKLAKITEDGVEFTSIYEPRQIKLTPEKSVQIQHDLGADLILAFDECTSPLATYKYTKESLERTHRWAERSLAEHKKLNKKQKTKQALFGIIQGSYYKDLRNKSTKFITGLDFDGIGVGGSLGKSKKDMHKILDWVIPNIPDNKPVHLLGIGAVEDLFECVQRGIDMFDCVGPTRIARIGYLYVHPPAGTKKNKFRIKIMSGKYKEDKKPIDPHCSCWVCKNYSRAYINHLFKSKELLAFELASYHNVHFILNLMREIRKAVNKNSFMKLKNKWLKK